MIRGTVKGAGMGQPSGLLEAPLSIHNDENYPCIPMTLLPCSFEVPRHLLHAQVNARGVDCAPGTYSITRVVHEMGTSSLLSGLRVHAALNQLADIEAEPQKFVIEKAGT